jgi:hypothetical protein
MTKVNAALGGPAAATAGVADLPDVPLVMLPDPTLVTDFVDF